MTELRLEKCHWDLLAASWGRVGGSEAGGSAAKRMLGEIGLLAEPSQPPAHAIGRSRLFGFACDHDLAVDLFMVSGVYLALANIQHAALPDAATTVSGTGFTPLEAVSGGLGEAVEYASWVFRPTDTVAPTVDAVRSAKTIDSARVLGFSRAQVASRARLNLAWCGWDRIPPAEVSHPGGLIEVHNLDETRAALCPRFLCHGHFGRLACGDPSLDVDSNGCAAGPNLADAKKRAVLELVERDAAGIWWNSGCVRRRFTPERDDPKVGAAIARHRQETGRRCWFLDIGVFQPVATIAAISSEPDGSQLAIGFGCDLDAGRAARSAFLEMIQCEIAVEAYEYRRREHRPVASDRQMKRWLRGVDIRRLPFILGDPVLPAPEAFARESSLDSLVGEIRAATGGEVWFAPLTRPEIGIAVVKALCEGLAHYKLRRGCERYTRVPQERGWVTSRAAAGRSDPFKLLI